MLARRECLALVGISVGAPLQIAPVRARAESRVAFADLLAQAIANPDLLERARGYREGAAIEFEARKAGPRYPPSGVTIPQAAVDLIIACEVTDRQRYVQRYQRPTWPKGKSGVTIGIGYDVGYVKPEWLREDWEGILDPRQISALAQACGIHGPKAQDSLGGLRGIVIDWDSAQRQFMTTSLPRFVAQTLAVLPHAHDLYDRSPKCFGALVSLVYNRGPSFKLLGDRYEEMRNLRLDMVRETYGEIPGRILGMRRLWPRDDPDVGGLYVRRTLEAELFREGLDEARGRS